MTDQIMTKMPSYRLVGPSSKMLTVPVTFVKGKFVLCFQAQFLARATVGTSLYVSLPQLVSQCVSVISVIQNSY